MKVFSSECTFDYSWDEVSTANWRKYCPWNDQSTHVIAVDTLARELDTKSGILRTERLITCKQSAPKFLSYLMGGSDVSYVYESSYVDPSTKTVTMLSRNLSWANVISVEEKVVYQPKADNRTLFYQEAQITALCGGLQRIKNGVEEASVTRFRENAQKGREGFEAVLAMSRRVFKEEKMKQQGVAMAA